LWLESSETSIEGVGGRVSTWKDTSGKANDATEFDTALQPLLLPGALHGKAAVGFDGNPSNLVVPDEPSLQFGTQPFTVAFVGEWHNSATPTLVDGTRFTYPGYGFIITKVIGGTPYTGVAISANAAAPFADVQAQRRLGVQLEIGTANLTSSAFGLNDGVFRLYVVERSAPGRVEIRINGVGQPPYDVPEGLDVSAFGHSLCLGGYLGNQLLGSLAELVMVKGPLTDAELHGLERYLIDKFGL